MDEKTSRTVVGIDIGTNMVRAVVGSVSKDGSISILGFGEVPSDGVRRGVVNDITAPVPAIDACLGKAEDLGGVQIDAATVSINGVDLTSTTVDGMIAVTSGEEITEADVDRLCNTAVTGKVPQNREILNIMPYEYILDGQRGIREPFGMKGTRLEMRANVISAAHLSCENLDKTYAEAGIAIRKIEPAVTAAAEAVLSQQQKENGVAVIDMGSATTSIAIYDEGELQYISVYPRGSNDVTNDLAAYLKTVPDVAEEIKLRFVSCDFGKIEKDVTIKRGRDEFTFSRKDVDDVVEARLEEIFEQMRKRLKVAGYDRRLPEGVILTGGGANLKDIDIYARTQMELAVRVGHPSHIYGLNEELEKRPEFATAVGLLFVDRNAQAAGFMAGNGGGKGKKKAKKVKSGESLFKRITSLFK